MKKIISLFQRNYETDRLVRDEVVGGAEWVVAGEGTATRKWDGTACMVKDGRLYKRYDVKKGRTEPPNFQPSQDADPMTGHWPGWVPVTDGPEDKWFRDAFDSSYPPEDGTFELCGPKVQGNPEKLDGHTLLRHGLALCDEDPRDFDELRDYFQSRDIEGIVWHHPDGRMVKIKGKDFGIKRP